MRKQAVLISAVALVLVLMVLGVGCGAAPGGKEVTVGNKNFTEQASAYHLESWIVQFMTELLSVGNYS